jgi:hypothetical protein
MSFRWLKLRNEWNNNQNVLEGNPKTAPRLSLKTQKQKKKGRPKTRAAAQGHLGKSGTSMQVVLQIQNRGPCFGKTGIDLRLQFLTNRNSPNYFPFCAFFELLLLWLPHSLEAACGVSLSATRVCILRFGGGDASSDSISNSISNSFVEVQKH